MERILNKKYLKSVNAGIEFVGMTACAVADLDNVKNVFLQPSGGTCTFEPRVVIELTDGSYVILPIGVGGVITK